MRAAAAATVAPAIAPPRDEPLRSDHVLGGKSLPTSIEQVKTWTDEATHGPLQAVLTKRDLQASRTKSDVRFLDSDGNLVAELLGVETHLLPRG